MEASSHILPIRDIPIGIPFSSYPQVVEMAGRDAILTVTVQISA